MSVNIHSKIVYRIRGKGRGWLFSAKDFLDFGTRCAVDKSLSRLADDGIIRRLRRGLYDFPKISPKLGALTPGSDQIAGVMAKKDQTRLQITGAHAANLLGLSTQVPAKVVYLTDGNSKKIKVGNQSIELRHASSKKMATAGKPSGLVIQALGYLGQDNVDSGVVTKIKKSLSLDDKKVLEKDIDAAPDWMRPVITQIIA